jgi:hypothetical protein
MKLLMNSLFELHYSKQNERMGQRIRLLIARKGNFREIISKRKKIATPW